MILPRRNDGSVLLTTVLATVVLFVLIGGMLRYLGNEHSLNLRSHEWTQALHLAEAGVEIGFAELNYQYFQDSSGFREDRGWSSIGGSSYTKTVTNHVDNLGAVLGNIQITAAGVDSIEPQIVAVGIPASSMRGPSIRRAVRATVALSGRFPLGMVAKREIDLKGNRIYTDSFDSTDPAKSTDGRYDITKRQPNGDIASNSELLDTISVGNADIYGVVHTGPGGSVALGPQGSVGATFNEWDRATTVEAGETNSWIRHDFGVDVPDVTLPPTLADAPSVGTINSTTTLTGGDWKADAIQLNASKTLTVQGVVRLYVTGNISIMGTTASIIIAPNSRLEVYVAGSVSIAGNGVINNTGSAYNNQFYGLPSSTSWSVSGNGNWVGTIYAPQANLTLNGGGTSGDMSGAVVSRSITLDGQVKFHYDESLRDNPNLAVGYVIVSWQPLRWTGSSWIVE